MEIPQLAPVQGGTHHALYQNPASVRAQADLAPIARVLVLAESMASAEALPARLHSPVRAVDGEAPLDLILAGRAREVAERMDTLRDRLLD